MKNNIKKLIKKIIYSISFVVTFLPACLLRIQNLYFLKCNVKRIGHLVVDITAYFEICETSNKHYLIIAPKSKIANACIKKYLPDQIKYIENELICKILSPLLFNPICSIDLSKYSESSEISFHPGFSGVR